MSDGEKIILIEVTQDVSVEKKHGLYKGCRCELIGIMGQITVMGKAGESVILSPGEYRVLFIDPRCCNL